MKKTKYIILSILIIKIILAFLPSFEIDMNAWLAWAYRLKSLGPSNFYSKSIWTQYTPGFLYYLLLIGKLNIVNPVIIKIPSIVAEVINSALISTNPMILLIYSLSPAIIFNSSIWGQIDGLLSLFLFLSIYFLVEKKKLTLAWLSWGIALLIKPQSFLLLPVLFLTSIKNNSLLSVTKSIFASLFLVFIFSLPFFPESPLLGLPKQIILMGQGYQYSSVFAFNFWQLAVGFWQPDALYVKTGLFLFSFSILLILLRLYSKNFKKREIYLAASLSALAFFLFPTRVHERYIFPFFPFILATYNSSKNKKYLYVYVLSTIAFLINLYYPYAYYNKNFLSIPSLKNLTFSLAPLVSTFYLSVFVYLLFYKSRIDLKLRLKFKNPLLWILTFALITRLFMLWLPKNEYFDEVYHAFTARQMFHNNPKAWEWWNPNPKGFAFEWTHPPLAKLGMVTGMFFLGENSFGWRLPGAILGTFSVYLVYLIAKNLFNKKVALYSALVFSLDGLTLVMSRIGMNDSYLLFFMLLSFYLYLTNKYFFSSLALGLAAASKWSILWFLPILAISHLSQKRKFSLNLIWFFIIPPVIYLASYSPMFVFPQHSIHTFIEVQKQMWWYHTNLKATHPYTSPWWSWPFLVRPIWLYVSYTSQTTIKNIYAMGNPIVFWTGILTIPYIFYDAFIQTNIKIRKNLGIVLFAYFVFFVPWALSPRIMFLYHYLPSIPFLSILMGYFLSRTKKYTHTFFIIALLSFIFFYPHWIGLEIPKQLDQLYYIFPSWK